MFHQQRFQALLIASAIVAITLVAGCQSSLPQMSLNPFKSSEPAAEFQQPVRVAVIWKETAVSRSGQNATRGFGGRVYFYNEDDEAVKVDGELSVFAFDDTNSKAEKSRVPDRKYVFRAADLQRHHGTTALGDSYNIWLPWDQVGGERKTISLVPVFKPTEGSMPTSDQSIAVLSGKTSEEESRFAQELGFNGSMVKQVAMNVPAGEPQHASRLGVAADGNRTPLTSQSAEKTVRTTTLEVSRSTANRMRMASRPAPRQRFVPGIQDRSATKSAEKKTQTAGQIQATEPAVNTGRPNGRATTNTETFSRTDRTTFGKPGAFR